MEQLGFMWYEVNTLRMGIEESINQTSMIGQREHTRALAVRNVLDTVTAKHRDILAVLARAQLEQDSSQGRSRCRRPRSQCSWNHVPSSRHSWHLLARSSLRSVPGHVLGRDARQDGQPAATGTARAYRPRAGHGNSRWRTANVSHSPHPRDGAGAFPASRRTTGQVKSSVPLITCAPIHKRILRRYCVALQIHYHPASFGALAGT